MSASAIIHQLKIDRFRGIESLKWNPAPGMNVLLGGGDAGKTTVLDAISLLLSPSNSVVLSESDYWLRKYDTEFVIQAIVSLPTTSEISHQHKFSWPWAWDGQDAILPTNPDSAEDDLPVPNQPVYRLQVRGSSDLEVSWEIVQPNGDTDPLTTMVRRKIGTVRLGGDDRNNRDLRLVYGSALDRLLADNGLKARIGQQVSAIDLQGNLSTESKQTLDDLNSTFKKESLPDNLQLGLTSSQGLSIGALIGLLAERSEGISLPLASWGAGTRRLATLQIAAATEMESRITVIDEIERGLEPYRVRKLVNTLQNESAQCFLTTHSPVTIRSAYQGCLWYLDQSGHLGELPRAKIARQQDRDPETFLSRLAIIAEGPTEVGFVSAILNREIDGDIRDTGLRVCDGQGNLVVLGLLQTMASANLTFGGFVDNEGDSPIKWANLKNQMGGLLFQWASGCTEENIIALVDENRLTELLQDEDGDIDQERCITLATRLGITDRSIATIVETTDDLRALIIAAATGNSSGAPDNEAKTWKKHGKRWFKSEKGGRELAEKMISLDVWPAIKLQLLPFLNAIRTELGQTPISDD